MSQRQVAQYKKDKVAELAKLMEDYPIIGTVNMANLPAKQLQNMRAQLRKMVVLTMAKRRLVKIALEQVKDKKKGIEKLGDHLDGMPALIFTKDNPFSLNKVIQKNKSPAPAKAGQKAPKDIIIPAGPTPFAPGPVIGELGSVGVKSGVEGGKVAVKEDSTVAKRGDTISPKLAEILTRLDIQPMEVGLDLMAVYEDGMVYTSDILNIDEVKFQADLEGAARWAVNLSVEAGYPTKDTAELMIIKAFRDAGALGRGEVLLEPELMGDHLTRAEREMLGLKSTANIPDTPQAPADDSKAADDKIEEKPAEEAKAETAEKGEGPAGQPQAEGGDTDDKKSEQAAEEKQEEEKKSDSQ